MINKLRNWFSALGNESLELLRVEQIPSKNLLLLMLLQRVKGLRKSRLRFIITLGTEIRPYHEALDKLCYTNQTRKAFIQQRRGSKLHNNSFSQARVASEQCRAVAVVFLASEGVEQKASQPRIRPSDRKSLQQTQRATPPAFQTHVCQRVTGEKASTLTQ